jgi:hypothetical protein
MVMQVKTVALRLLFAAVSAVMAATQLVRSASTGSAARVFITDSSSWEIGGYSASAGNAGGSVAKGGGRPQTAEIIKTFRQRCPQVTVNNIQSRADYIVLLDHEGGKSFVRHKNKVAVFARISGDSIMSKSTLSLGGSVQEACEAINQHWAAHAAEMTAAAVAEAKPAVSPGVASPDPPAAKVLTGKMSIVSDPDGAEIELDGSFVGDTPSDIEVLAGEHVVTVKKAGFTNWERQLKVRAGSGIMLKAELEKSQ